MCCDIFDKDDVGGVIIILYKIIIKKTPPQTFMNTNRV